MTTAEARAAFDKKIRTEITAHGGTTINPEYFRHQPFYTLTPSLGCFTARELYNPKNGRLAESAQIEMVEAFLGAEGENGCFLAIWARGCFLFFSEN